MKFIPLTQGKLAMVDDEDYERLSKFKWMAAGCRGRYYAVRQSKRDGRRFREFMHRVIFKTKSRCVDHIDNDPLNNQKSNLRRCSYVQNGRNRKLQNHSSKFKGVHFQKAASKWTASVQVNRKKIHLGTFVTEHLAAQAYDSAAQRFYGQFSRTNQQMGVL